MHAIANCPDIITDVLLHAPEVSHIYHKYDVSSEGKYLSPGRYLRTRRRGVRGRRPMRSASPRSSKASSWIGDGLHTATPLHLAVAEGRVSAVTALIAAGADINATARPHINATARPHSAAAVWSHGLCQDSNVRPLHMVIYSESSNLSAQARLDIAHELLFGSACEQVDVDA